MEYHFMSKDELDIANLSNIRSISLYDILSPNYSNTNSLMGIVTFCDNAKYYNYVQTDEYFDIYLQKLISQYQLEKANNSQIEISEGLRKVFDGAYADLSGELQQYFDMEGFDIQKIRYQQDVVKEYINIIFHYIEQVGKLSGNDLALDRYLIGYRNIYKIKGLKNNIPVEYKLLLERIDEYEIDIKVCDFFDIGNDLKLSIFYRDNKIHISWNNRDNILVGDADHYYDRENFKYTSSIYHGDDIIFYDSGDDTSSVSDVELELVNKYLKLYGYQGDAEILKLPWGDYRVVYKTKEKINNVEVKESITYLDITITDNYAFIKRQSESTLFNTQKKYKLRVDGIKSKTHIELIKDKNENYVVSETKFSHSENAISKYKNNLADKCFYQGFKTSASSLKEIGEEILAPISDLGIYDKGYEVLKRARIRTRIGNGDINGDI